MGLSETAREAALAAIATDTPAFKDAGAAVAAVALRSLLPNTRAPLDAGRIPLTERLNWLTEINESSTVSICGSILKSLVRK